MINKENTISHLTATTKHLLTSTEAYLLLMINQSELSDDMVRPSTAGFLPLSTFIWCLSIDS